MCVCVYFNLRHSGLRQWPEYLHYLDTEIDKGNPPCRTKLGLVPQNKSSLARAGVEPTRVKAALKTPMRQIGEKRTTQYHKVKRTLR